MEILEYVLAPLGAIGLTLGYRRNSRNLLLASALTLCVAFNVGDAISGFQDGWNGSAARTL